MVKVEHPKLKLGITEQVSRKGLITNGVALKAVRARSPKVIVTDAYCRPLAGAKVYMRANFGLKHLDTPVGATDSAGKLTVPAAYHGSCYTFGATLPGYTTPGISCPPVGSENWIDLIEITMGPTEEPK